MVLHTRSVYRKEYEYGKKHRRLRSSLPYQDFDLLFYLGGSGTFPQIRHNIRKVVQKETTYLQNKNRGWKGKKIVFLRLRKTVQVRA